MWGWGKKIYRPEVNEGSGLLVSKQPARRHTGERRDAAEQLMRVGE
jgi:hypothetical protein